MLFWAVLSVSEDVDCGGGGGGGGEENGKGGLWRGKAGRKDWAQHRDGVAQQECVCTLNHPIVAMRRGARDVIASKGLEMNLFLNLKKCNPSRI